MVFDYLPDTVDFSDLPEGSQRYRTVIVDGVSLTAGVWHHVAVTVYAEDAAVYINGTVEGVQSLEGKMVDTNQTLLLGEATVNPTKHTMAICHSMMGCLAPIASTILTMHNTSNDPTPRVRKTPGMAL